MATTTYWYDNAGNLASTSAGLVNTWDYRNRLTRTVEGTTNNYAYDHTDARVRFAESSTINYYPNKFYSAVSKGSAATTTKNIYARDVLVATIARTSTTLTPTWFHTDHLGGTNVVTNASSTVLQTLEYYPYGTKRINTGSDVSQREFTGEVFDESREWSYLNARYYDGGRGQFLSQDPSFLDIGGPGFEQNYERTLQQHLMNPQALNSYSYALNNPIRYSDPEGEIVPVLVLGALAFYGGYSAGTDLYEGYTSGDNGQFAWGVVGAAGSLVPGGGAAKGAAAFADDAARGVTNLSKNFFRGGEVKFDPGDFRETLTNGKINPSKAVEGISVNLSQKWATAKGNGISTQIKSLPKGLQITQQGKNLSHYVIRPTKEMTVNQFKNLINKMNSRIKSKN